MAHLAEQEKAFEELTGRYPAEDAEAALREVLAERPASLKSLVPENETLKATARS